MSAFFSKAAVKEHRFRLSLNVCFRPGADIRIFSEIAHKSHPLTVNTSALSPESVHSSRTARRKSGKSSSDRVRASLKDVPIVSTTHIDYPSMFRDGTPHSDQVETLERLPRFRKP